MASAASSSPDQLLGRARVEVGELGARLLGGEQVDVGGGRVGHTDQPQHAGLVRQVVAGGEQHGAVEG